MGIIASRYAIFNGYNLNNIAGLSVNAIDLPGQQTKSINVYPLARVNARKVSSAQYQSNQINIGIYITASTREKLEQALDTLYANIQGLEGTLQLPVSGTTRNYTATYQSTTINNAVAGTASAASNYADLILVFQCSDSYGYDVGPTLITNTLTQTTSSANFAYTQGGGAEWQVPIVQIRIDALTGGTGASIVIGNNANGQACTINRTWSQYDLLLVDSQNKRVMVNGVDVAFSGAIPEFNTGAQTLTYNDTFSTRTVEIYATVTNRWH